MAATAAAQRSVDARQLGLCEVQCILVLERCGKLLGVARQVCLLAPQAVLRRFELRAQGVEDMVQALNEAGAIGLHLVQVECADGGVLECLGTLGAAQTEANGTPIEQERERSFALCIGLLRVRIPICNVGSDRVDTRP